MRFSITYTEPKTLERITIEDDFEDTFDPVKITAREWAEDLAYSLADKCMDYVIKELPEE